MNQIFSRVYLAKSINKDEYLKVHRDIASNILSDKEEKPFKELSAEAYIKTHEVVVGSIIDKHIISAKSEADYFSEYEKTIRDMSFTNSLPYPVDMYLSIHKEIIAGVKQYFNNRTLLFNLSSDKYLYVIVDMDKDDSLSGYKLLFKPLNGKENRKKHYNLALKVRGAIDEESKNVYLGRANNFSLIKDIIGRVEKRKVYYHLFHKGLVMGELNEIALYCFWILKCQPFKYKNDKSSNASSGEWDTDKVNLLIALSLFLSVIYDEKKDFNPSESFIRTLKYSFKYHDLSKEAIMTLAASLVV